MQRLARAKINLALHVTGQRADDYHLIDSLVTFAEYGDVIAIEPAHDITLSIDGPFAEKLNTSANNLVLKAAKGLSELDAAPNTGAAIHLTKNLPVASGIGGGSADAAATLSALIDFWKFSPDRKVLQSLALSLGADVPMCLTGRPCIARSIGDELTSISLPAMNMVLANPLTTVSTPSVFKALTSKNNAPLEAAHSFANIAACIDYLNRQRNDLFEPSLSIAPEIGECFAALKQSGADFVSMSGSGATCFGIYAEAIEKAEQAALKIQHDHPKWWVQATTTIE